MSTRRQERVSERIHEEISDLLQNRIRDPRLEGITVIDVQITPDLKLATVFISTLGDEQERKDALAGLEHASSFVRRRVAQALQLRYAPELRFMLDDTWQRGALVDELLEQLRTSSPSSAASEETHQEQADGS